MNVLYINPSDTAISTAKTASRFGPLDAQGLGCLRLDYCSDNTDPIQVVDNRFRFTIDLLKGLNPDGTALFPPIYRKEYTDWPWMLNLPRGTTQLLSKELSFRTPPNNKTAISIFQSYARTKEFGKVGQQIEIAYANQFKMSKAGEIQIVNLPAGTRALTGIVAEEGLSIIVEMETFFETKENGGMFRVKFDGKVVYEGYENTLYAECPVAPQPKMGVYHHALRTAPEGARKLNIDAGHTKFEMDMGPVTIVREVPGVKLPSWAYALASPRNTLALENQFIEEGRNLVYPTVERLLDELSTISNQNVSLKMDLASKTANLADLLNKYTNLKTTLAQLANG